MNEEERKHLDRIFELMKTTPNERLSETFIGALKLSNEQKDLVNFVFWMCYMIETDLDAVIQNAWKYANEAMPSSPEGDLILQQMLSEKMNGYGQGKEIDLLLETLEMSNESKNQVRNHVAKNYSLKRPFKGMEDLPFFIDKIRVMEALSGKNRHVRLIYKINNIRNDLSHNRIDTLEYEGESLLLRSVKEKLIRDIFESTLEDDRSQSEFWNSLTPEQIEEILKMRENFPKITNINAFRNNIKP